MLGIQSGLLPVVGLGPRFRGDERIPGDATIWLASFASLLTFAMQQRHRVSREEAAPPRLP